MKTAVLQYLMIKTFTLQAMPQLTDRSKLPSILDPVIRDTMDLKHLYQVHWVEALWSKFWCLMINLKFMLTLYRLQQWLYCACKQNQVIGHS